MANYKLLRLCQVIFLLLLIFEKARGQSCTIEGITGGLTSLTIVDTDSTIDFARTTTNTNGIQTTIPGDFNKGPYLNYELTGGTFIISLRAEFKDYEIHETQTNFIESVLFSCTTGTLNLVISYNIVDTNNHDPELIPNTAFSYEIYTPLPADFPISLYMGEFKARDVDLTNTRIIPIMEDNPYLKLDYLRVDPDWRKDHFLDLRTSRIIQSLSEPVIIDFEIEDFDTTGNSSRTRAGTVTIMSNPETAIPVTPIFEQAFYKGVYKDGVFTTEKSVKLTEGYVDDIVFAITGAGSEYFNLDITGNNVDIVLRTTIPDDIVNNNLFMLFTMTATNKDIVGSTAIHVEFPKESPVNIEHPLFERAFYSGIYENNSVVFATEIRLIQGYNDSTVFELDGDDAVYFKYTQRENIVEIDVIAPIPDDIIRSRDFMIFSLMAKISGLTGTTAINVALPSDFVLIQFEKPSYEVYYNRDHTITQPDIILKDGYSEDVRFSIEGDMSNYFTVNNDREKVTLAKIIDLPPEILNLQAFINVIIRAYDDKSNSGLTTLTMNLPDYDVIYVQFERPSYEGEYDRNHTLTHSKIVLTVGFSPDVIFTIDDESNKYFKISADLDELTVTVVNHLPDDVLDANPYWNVVIKASIDDSTGFAILTLALPGIVGNAMRFDRPNYEGEYSRDHVVSHPGILLNGFTDRTTFSLQDEMRRYFRITNTGASVTVSTLVNLPQSMLDSLSFLNLIITATDTSGLAYATLTLSLPETNTTDLRFDSANYEGTYSVDHIVTHPTISLERGYTDDVKFAIQEEYRGYFRVSNVFETVTITKTVNLPDDVLGLSHINLIISAIDDVNLRSAYTTLTLTLVKNELVPLRFSQSSYTGTYSEDHSVTHELIRVIEGYTDDVRFELNPEDAEYFTITNTDERVTITRLRNLPSEVIDSNTFINLVIWARDSQREISATLTLSLPGTENFNPPRVLRFERPKYVGEYSTDHRLSHDKIQMAEGFGEGVIFTLDGEMKQLFTISNVGDVVTVNVKGQIPENILIYDRFITLAIWAKAVGSIDGSTTLTIELPEIGTISEFPSLYVTRIIEEEVYDDILQGVPTSCEFEITNSWPANQIWFKIKDGKLACSEVDRENETIAFLPKSQVQIELTCKSGTFDDFPVTLNSPKNAFLTRVNQLAVCDINEDNRQWIYTGHIANTPTQRLVTVIINDVNDNSPKFTVRTPHIVGYPNRDFIGFVRPTSLTTVQATDLDICYNAEIKYSTSSEYFSVHPKSGTVYPNDDLHSLIDDSHTFAVSATDQDGNGLKTDLQIHVKLLDLEHVALIYVKDAQLENTQDIVGDISARLNLDVKSLTSFMMPLTTESRILLNVKAKAMLRLELTSSLGIFMYAFNADNNAMTATELIRSIDEILGSIPWTLQTIPLSDSDLYELRQTSNGDVGLIIGLSIVSVIAFGLIVFLIVWFVVIMPRRYQRFYGSETSSVVGSETSDSKDDEDDDVEDKPTTLEVTFDNNEEKSPYLFNSESKPDNDDKGPEARRATVTFKETVQQIDILDYGEENESDNE